MSDLLNFNTYERTTSAGMWIKKSLPDSPLPAEICGNVMVKCIEAYTSPGCGDYVFHRWAIFLRIKDQWIQVHPKTRPYPYGSIFAAKVGARLMGNQHGRKKPA
jgi:hypothetical protein